MTPYIEEAVEFLAGEFNASDHGEEVIRTTLIEVDRRARVEVVEEIRNRLTQTGLYIVDKRFNASDPSEYIDAVSLEDLDTILQGITNPTPNQ